MNFPSLPPFAAPLPLALAGPPVLAFGAWFKNALCRAQDGVAVMSESVGDLDSPEARAHMDALAEALLASGVPAAIAHDLHPDFHSSRRACELAEHLGVPAIPVQHHHAHVAAVLAENKHPGPALGVALDGVGFGTDGTAWGGELLRVEGASFERLGHLDPLPLAGGDRAAREPWRMAAAVLHRAGRAGEIAGRFAAQPAAAMLAQLLDRAALCPPTSSLGRVFDAAAGLLGLCPVMRVEAEAAIALERAAAEYLDRGGNLPAEAGAWIIDGAGRLDLMPLLVALADEPDAARGAARFHVTLAAALADWVLHEVARTGLDVVALSGGCLHNRILSQRLGAALRAHGLTVLEAQRLSPGDAGLALGQAWVAIHHLNRGACGAA
ncbi:carbamoyltransferase HypF [Aromatoleum toluolicum]|uniref:Carbamoyltransferase HypF n=1 Tax=Aromatoleum toluolicum TaxID=90060 RepID=A0ABX1NER7_9RHOO|nr:carbamoyltransferase HypF [Aromatoleum toluolicum]NMF97761.1 carbamoyltransferase HypF [Aromatoleum toluolicum]